jgi:hypothetical protein
MKTFVDELYYWIFVLAATLIAGCTLGAVLKMLLIP